MTALADALDKLAEAIAQAALEIRGVGPPEAPSVPPAARPTADAPGFDELPPSGDTSWVETDDYPPMAGAPPTASASVCPSHGIAWLKGKYGPYCPSMSTDAKWSNDRGYCTITPKNADLWRKQHP